MVWHPAAAAGELRQRQLRDLQSSTAYMTLLWCEQPAYRGRLFKYVMEGLLRRRRPWRNPAAASPGPPALGWSALRARLSGPLVYARLRRELLQDDDNVTMRVQKINDIEHKGDDLTHSIINQLNQTFITPFDRE